MQVRLSNAERAVYCKNALAKKLFSIMDVKRSNLALSADVTQCKDVLALADTLGSEICVLKTHVDILEDFTPSFISALQQLAVKHNFLIFEDRKFADIGNTVKLQYEKGVYRIADWADMVNAHGLPGSGIVSGLAEIGLKHNRGLLLLAEMSSANNLFTEDYAMQILLMAEQFPEFVMGFISQKKLSEDPHWIYMTPGVQLKEGKDTLGQQYVTPHTAIVTYQSDIIIVGRGIIHADDVLGEAKQYREAGWNAYEKQI